MISTKVSPTWSVQAEGMTGSSSPEAITVGWRIWDSAGPGRQ